MAHVISRNFGNWWDIKAEVAFKSIHDLSTDTYIGHANVDLDAAKEKGVDYEARPGFEVLSDEDFTALCTRPVPDVPSAPTTGDPLGDAGVTAPKTRQLTKTDSPEPAPGEAAALGNNSDGIPASATVSPAPGSPV